MPFSSQCALTQLGGFFLSFSHSATYACEPILAQRRRRKKVFFAPSGKKAAGKRIDTTRQINEPVMSTKIIFPPPSFLSRGKNYCYAETKLPQSRSPTYTGIYFLPLGHRRKKPSFFAFPVFLPQGFLLPSPSSPFAPDIRQYACGWRLLHFAPRQGSFVGDGGKGGREGKGTRIPQCQ